MNLPFERTWWIEPGKIIGGRYPGTPQPKESRQMREKLLTAGVRVFVNLQEPDEAGGNGQTFPDYESEIQELAREHAVEVTCFRFPIEDNNIPTEAVGLGRQLHLWPDKALGSNAALKEQRDPAEYRAWLAQWWGRISEWPQ